MAEAAVAKDLEDEPDYDPDHPIDDEDATEDESDSEVETLHHTTSRNAIGPSMVGSYRRPSFALAGSRATIATSLQGSMRTQTKSDRREARREERSLLRDNNVSHVFVIIASLELFLESYDRTQKRLPLRNRLAILFLSRISNADLGTMKIIPPKHPQKADGSDTFGRRLSRHLSVPNLGIPGGDRKVVRSDEEASGDAGLPEITPLLGDPDMPYGGQDSPNNLDKQWEAAVLEGKIQTTWQRETKVLVRYSAPLVLTFLLQYSLTVASVFTVGHLGKVELGAVSLASMTANITGYAVYQGLATSLDTLCAQAYGSGRKKLVGLQTQRMVYFLWAITIPIGIIWLCAEMILMKIVPEEDVAILAGQYLQIVLIGAPGYAFFESAKRYMQAQGLFSASLYVLLICAPLNVFLNWLFVWVCIIYYPRSHVSLSHIWPISCSKHT